VSFPNLLGLKNSVVAGVAIACILVVGYTVYEIGGAFGLFNSKDKLKAELEAANRANEQLVRENKAKDDQLKTAKQIGQAAVKVVETNQEKKEETRQTVSDAKETVRVAYETATKKKAESSSDNSEAAAEADRELAEAQIDQLTQTYNALFMH